MNPEEKIVTFAPVKIKDIPRICVLKDADNQKLVQCECGEYYYYDFNERTAHELIHCPWCFTNVKINYKQHSGGFFNAGTF